MTNVWWIIGIVAMLAILFAILYTVLGPAMGSIG